MIPFTTVTDDNNHYYDWLMSILPVDVFTPNAGYRGQPQNNVWSFSNLWSGDPSIGFSGFYALSCKYQVPVLIGEMNPVGCVPCPIRSVCNLLSETLFQLREWPGECHLPDWIPAALAGFDAARFAGGYWWVLFRVDGRAVEGVWQPGPARPAYHHGGVWRQRLQQSAECPHS